MNLPVNDDPLPIDLNLSRVGLAAIIGACGIGIGIVLVALNLMQRLGQVESSVATLATFERCQAPAKTGDSTVITVRHDGAQLLTRCQHITDWRAPERAGK